MGRSSRHRLAQLHHVESWLCLPLCSCAPVHSRLLRHRAKDGADSPPQNWKGSQTGVRHLKRHLICWLFLRSPAAHLHGKIADVAHAEQVQQHNFFSASG